MPRPLTLTLLLTLALAAAAEAQDVSFERDIQPFLKQHCYACHGADEQESQIRYDEIAGYAIEHQHLWTAVHEKLSAGEMPPEDRPQPSDEQRQQVLRWIEQQSTAAQKALGTGSLRRLNRREFSAALQDVTGLSVNYADGLPGDGTVNGFDTGAEALQDAADSVAAALRVTRRAVDAIYFLDARAPEKIAVDFRDSEDERKFDVRKAFDSWKEIGVQSKIRGDVVPQVGLLIEPKWVGERGSQEIYVPVPADRRGVVRLKLSISVVKSDPAIPNPMLWVEVGGKDIDFHETSASPDDPEELTYEIQLEDVAVEAKGLKIMLSNKVEVPYSVKGFENEDKTKPEEKIPGGPGLFRPVYDRKAPPEQQPVPYIALAKIEIVPNVIAQWPPSAWDADIGEIADDLASAKRLLDLWIERAWRRSVNADEQQRFVAFYEQLRKQGMSFDDALRATFQSVLMSSEFRYLASPADANPLIAQYAIASRLSFMLWGAPPDEQLRALAASGKLRDPKVLDAQVDRLLDDSRSDAFVRPFVTQWLVLEQPITIVMDYLSQQDFRFGRRLKESMREETISYVAEMLATNRPIDELIDSDWTMMNESLAIFYGYDEIRGGQMRRVKLRNDDPRGGGLLSHAGIQSMLCWMGENWVIYRGSWVLRQILDDPPPPPPLDVPELIPSDNENRGKTYRELLAQHQEDAKCSVCHKTIDPLGFAFQNFDLSGRWREQEYERYTRNELDGKIEWRGVGKTRPVDSEGQLPRGDKYTTFAKFKQQLTEHYQNDIVRGLLKNLMLFATGRKPDVEDMAEIRQIISEQADDNYPLRGLVKAVIRSDAFLAH